MLLEVTYQDIHALIVETLKNLLSEAYQPFETFLPFNRRIRVTSAAEAKMVNIVNKESRELIKQGKNNEALKLIDYYINNGSLPPNIMAKHGIRSVGRPKGSVSKPKTKRGRAKGSFNFDKLYKNSIQLKSTTGQKAMIATEIPGVTTDPTYIYQYMDDYIYDAFFKELLNFLKKPNNDAIIEMYVTDDGVNLFNQFSQAYKALKTLMEQFQFTASDVKMPESPYDLFGRMSGYLRDVASAIKELAFMTTTLKMKRFIKNNQLDLSIAERCGRHAVISFNKLVILDERTSMQYVSILNDKADYLEKNSKNSMMKRDIPAYKARRK